MRQQSVVFVDLDSTVCDTRHRHHLISRDANGRPINTDWTAYSMACADDTPMESVVQLVRLLSETNNIVILSGRNVEARDLTEAWLLTWGVPYDDLLLRPANDARPNGTFKADSILKYRAEHPWARPVLLIDDWPPVKPAVEKLGIPVVVVNPLYDESLEGETYDGATLANGQRMV